MFFFFLLGAAAAAAAAAASPAVSQLPNNVCSRGPSCSHEPLALPSNLPESRSIPLSEEERSPACIISGAALQGAVAVAAAAAAAIYSRRKKNRARCTTRLVFSLVPQARCREKAKCTMQMRRMHRRSELAKKNKLSRLGGTARDCAPAPLTRWMMPRFLISVVPSFSSFPRHQMPGYGLDSLFVCHFCLLWQEMMLAD